MHLLFVCTGNQCRSPMAEVIARHHLATADRSATVESAGLLDGGRPASSHSVAVMAGRGHDLRGHRSRRLDAAMVARSDLVVGMAREHVREAVVLEPSAFGRAFTLKDLVRRGEEQPRGPGEPVAAWIERLAASRPRAALMGVGHDAELDVADPIGGPVSGYRSTATELDDLIGRLVTVLCPVEVSSP